MDVTIRPGTARGTVKAPPSKSYAHRLLICAALADGESAIEGIADSEDMRATLGCVSALGREYGLIGGSAVIYRREKDIREAPVFPCRESGSTLRFFIPISLALCGGGTFTGTERLMQRGIGVYEELLGGKGIEIKKDAGSVSLHGGLRPGEYTLRGDVSSQFVSGLLFALPLLDGDSVIRVLPPVESRAYIDITIAALRAFGVEIEEAEKNTFHIKGGQSCAARSARVEGDWSNAAALLAFNALGGEVMVTGLNDDSLQGDRVCAEYLRRLEEPGAELELSGCPDLGPVLFAAAAAKHGARFTGTRRLRIKESDRAQAMADELIKFGIRTEIKENSVTIFPGKLRAPREKLSAHNDHRIAMALSLLASITGGTIEGAECEKKSYPDFFGTLEELGLEISYGTD